ncbi:MAG: hypothetical protein QF430_03155 [Candidatus Marinimicrobia bacterium]|jgi:hypothetical protein|nr:hypothetical protein [Candidatus Neomarinimicrobiota bacterium]MDP7071863.1 hypothetical protein [Candidatus Neomarinimicrobiota bacterium]
MNQMVILIIVLLIIVSFLISGKEQTKKAEEEKDSIKADKEGWEREKVMEIGEIHSRKNALDSMVDSAFPDDPDQRNDLKEAIQEWADMKEKVFSERRSWVRKPEHD